jgi:hypothetical protein
VNIHYYLQIDRILAAQFVLVGTSINKHIIIAILHHNSIFNIMSSELSGALSSLNIGNNESKNEKETTNNDTDINTATKCTNCGKEGDGDSMNTCNKCDLVKYCNAACKKKHKSKHKKKCEKRAAELFDEKLFNKEPPEEECPICMLPLPLAADQITFHSCCGKDICNGCIRVMDESEGADLCAFCRTPVAKSDKEQIERVNNLMEKGNPNAFCMLAGFYAEGRMGLPQNRAKANELYRKAGELGCALAYINLGNAYYYGEGVEIDTKKTKYFFELAAMNGNVWARYNLGVIEGQAGNLHRAMKHCVLAAKAGHEEALEAVKQGFMGGVVAKDEYANTLREYHESQTEMKSEERDKAARTL